MLGRDKHQGQRYGLRLILGSQSTTRQRLLHEAGYEFEVMPSDFDEFSVRVADPTQLALILARGEFDALLSRTAQLVKSDFTKLHSFCSFSEVGLH